MGGESHEANFSRFFAASKGAMPNKSEGEDFCHLCETISFSSPVLKQPWKIPNTGIPYEQKLWPRPVQAFLLKKH
jgi:hypothetical protein